MDRVEAFFAGFEKQAAVEKTVKEWRDEMKHWSSKDIRRASRSDWKDRHDKITKPIQNFAIAARATLEKNKAKAPIEKQAIAVIPAIVASMAAYPAAMLGGVAGLTITGKAAEKLIKSKLGDIPKWKKIVGAPVVSYKKSKAYQSITSKGAIAGAGLAGGVGTVATYKGVKKLMGKDDE